MSASNELADITTCAVCGQKFTGPRLQVIGEPNARLRKYIEGLSQHFAEKHPEVSRAMDAQALFYCGWLFLRNFKTTDPELKEERDRKRWEVHQQTLNARFTGVSLRRQCEIRWRKGYCWECFQSWEAPCPDAYSMKGSTRLCRRLFRGNAHRSLHRNAKRFRGAGEVRGGGSGPFCCAKLKPTSASRT